MRIKICVEKATLEELLIFRAFVEPLIEDILQNTFGNFEVNTNYERGEK